jgi:hypothetical protein
MSPLKEFGLPEPEGVLEHAEYVYLVNWLDEFITKIAKGEETLTSTMLNIDLAKQHLQDILPNLLDKHYRDTF